MPHKFDNEPDDQGVVIKMFGQIQGEEIYNINEQLMSDPLFVRWRYQIWDFSEVEDFIVSIDQMRLFAIQDSAGSVKNPNQKIAIIPRKINPTGVDRTFHTLEQVWGGYQSRSFPDIDAARQWAASV
jgi:hypothetical protein